MRGHFDDPRAVSCSAAGVDEDGDPTYITPEMNLQLCRQRFVVEGFEILGPDPSFAPS